MTKTSAELEREVEQSRGDLDRTVAELKDKMTPTQLMGELNHALGGAGNQILSKLVEQAKENPMPTLLIGAGLAWLMIGSGKSGSASGSTSGAAGFQGYGAAAGNGASNRSGLMDKASNAAAAVGDKAQDIASSAKDAAASAASGASDIASNAIDAAKQAGQKFASAAGSAGDMAGDLGQRAQDGFVRALHDEPLIIGAIGLAVGVAIGAALPSTSFEDEKVGAVRDQLVEKGKSLVQDQLGAAQDVAGSAFATVRDEIGRQQGPDGAESLGEKVAHVAQAGVQAVQDGVHDKMPGLAGGGSPD